MHQVLLLHNKINLSGEKALQWLSYKIRTYCYYSWPTILLEGTTDRQIILIQTWTCGNIFSEIRDSICCQWYLKIQVKIGILENVYLSWEPDNFLMQLVMLVIMCNLILPQWKVSTLGRSAELSGLMFSK